ncbi:hypothetical protein I6E23_11795 [Prevotella brevis]|nr:hypothetical protein [Xylanibacter brevis]
MQARNITKPLLKIPFSTPLTAGAKVTSMEFKERLLLLKRKAFEYEDEYRAIIVKPKAAKSKGILVDIPNLHSLIKKIMIGPSAGDDTFTVLSNLFVHTYGFSLSDIERSDLYKKTTSSDKYKNKVIKRINGTNIYPKARLQSVSPLLYI